MTRLVDILTTIWCASTRRSSAHLPLLIGGLIGRLLTSIQVFPTMDFQLEAVGIIKQRSQDVFILKE